MELEVGEFWAVGLPDGGFGALQVRDVKRSGTGARTTFIAGVVDWQGDEVPVADDLRGRRVLAQGMVRVEVFTEGHAVVLGRQRETSPVDGLTSAYRDTGVGTVTEVWGWKALPKRVQLALAQSG